MNYLISIFLFGSLTFRGDLPVQADYCLSYPTDSTLILEIFYEIPRSSLIFIKTDSGFRSSYEIALFGAKRGEDFSLMSKKKGELWVETYSETKGGEREEGHLLFSLPASLSSFLLTFTCLNSDLTATTQFSIRKREPILLKKGGKITFSERFLWKDTISLHFSSPPKDSYQVILSRGHQKVFIRSLSPNETLMISLSSLPAVVNDTSGFYLLQIFYSRSGEKIKELPISITTSPFLSDKEWMRKVSLLSPIASEGEIRRLKFTPEKERASAWEEFWAKREESEQDYFARVDYCLKNFSFGDKGLASDRAKIYLRYGPPDSIEEYPYETNRKPYIIWRYFKLGLEFVFVDTKGIGEYILVK